MNISFGSLMTGLLFGSIFLGFMVLILKKKKLNSRFHINFITICILLVVVRMIVPVEIMGAKTIACTVFLPGLKRFFKLQLGQSAITVESVLLFLWGAVALVKFSVFLVSHIKFRRFITSMEFCKEAAIRELLDKICMETSHKNRFRVILIEGCQSPFIYGMIKPIIILPELELEPSELEFILRHETSHHFHHDLWKKYIMELSCIFYWWNPLMYYLKKELDIMLEICRDTVITEKLDENKKIEYLECLLKIGKEKKECNQSQSLAFCKNVANGGLEQRFRYILENLNAKKKYNKYICWLICVGLLLLSFCFIFEPFYKPTEYETNMYRVDAKSSYILQKDGKLYLYFNDENYMEINEIEEPFKNLPVYTERKE